MRPESGDEVKPHRLEALAKKIVKFPSFSFLGGTLEA